MEQMIKLLVEESSSSVWIKNLDLEYIYVNKSFTRFTKKKTEEIIGFKNKDIFSKEIAKKIDESCRKVIESGKDIVEELYENNEYNQCTFRAIKDNNGKTIGVAGILVIINNLNKIKELQVEDNRKKDLITNIMDLLPGMIFYKDKEGKYLYANEAFKNHYKNRGINTIIGKTDREINNNKEIVNEFENNDKKILKLKELMHLDISFNNKSGLKTYEEVIKVPCMDEYGNVIGIVGRSLDVTEKMIYQEKLEYLSYTDIVTGCKNRTYFEVKEKLLAKEKFLPLGVIMGDANGLKLINDTFGYREGDNFLMKIGKILKKACNCDVFRMDGDEFVILLPNTDLIGCENLIKRIIKICEESESKLFNFKLALGAAIKEDLKVDIYEILKVAEDKVYRQKLLQKQSIKGSILNSLKIGFAYSTEETEQHTERVSENAMKLGVELGLQLSELDELRIAANFHDIGKIGIKEEILLKPGKLTIEEYEEMKTHVEKSYRIMKASSELQSVAESVLCHHERWDGNGYPYGLKGNEIPLLSRIISICDAYDVMISKRIYKNKMSKEVALIELKRCAGTQFDPDLVKLFIKLQLEQ